jgi:hypothetical protein
LAAERKPGSDRGRPAIDWERAFLFYAALPAQGRSYAAVAAEFGVSVRTVERHGQAEGWRARALEIDRQAAATAAARLADQRAETLTDIQKLVEASLVAYAQNLREDKLRLAAADLPRLHKLLRELWEAPQLEPSEPHEQLPPEDGPDPLEHKLQVLQALQEAGLLEQLHQGAEQEDARGGGDSRPNQDGGEQPEGEPPGHREQA